MRQTSFDTVVQAVGFLLEVAAMVLLSAVGFLAERAGFAQLTTGPDVVALWLLGVGAVALYAGVYMLGYQRLLPRLRATVGVGGT